MQVDDERVLDGSQQVALCLGAKAIANLERGFFEHLEATMGVGVDMCNATMQEQDRTR